MLQRTLVSNPPRWELAAEAIAVKMRWIGLLIGYLFVNLGPPVENRAILNAILAFGGLYTLIDTAFSFRGRVFLGSYPLSISVMEALFVGLLCFFHTGMDSPFRYYYILSLICCSIRHSARITLITCGLHWISCTALFLSLPASRNDLLGFLLMLIVLGWVTWAGSAMALLIKRISDHLGKLNSALQENQTELEARIEHRTQQLQEAQAHVLHQEKMAAFGLLAAGIAHEVGNPLTSISSIVQMLERHDLDEYSRERLSLVGGQLQRIRGTLRELIEFSRPASTVRSRVSLAEIIDEALNIAKYYKGMKSRMIVAEIPHDLPPLHAVRDQLVQIFLNLILNAIDATEKNDRIEIQAKQENGYLNVTVRDNGCGMAPAEQARLFQPYFTTKKNGTGLGLFVTRQLVAEHGGEVSFRSAPEAGTEFVVKLPCRDFVGVTDFGRVAADLIPSPLMGEG
ncbi:MAG TPA: ATP-binding protein [Gemmataceae bacterium]|nr:ATP-binding protein [Gemmataceae bacterium]